MALGPIKPRESAHRVCEQALCRAVLVGELKPGDRLPPERALAETLGVSRLTLRAALATLAAQGLLTVRQGSGYVVQDVARAGGSLLLPAVAELAAEQGDLSAVAADLLRVRRHIAHAVLEHLAEHPPKASAVRAVELAVDRMADLVEGGGDGEAIAGADLDVVAALLDATGSAVFRLCLNPVIAVVATNATLRAALYAEPMTNVIGWRALAAWLRQPAHPERIVTVLATHDAATLARFTRRRSR